MALISNLQFVGSERTTINLGQFFTTNIADLSGYEAGEIAGWFSIIGSTRYRFWFSARFARNGLNSDYWISPSTMGDAPPAGFSMSISSAGVVQVFLPTIAGFVSASVTYALDAPAVGAQYPLSVNGNQITSGTPTVSGLNPTDSTGLTLTGAINNTYTGVTAATTLNHSHYYVSATGASTYTITLPTAVGIQGRVYVIKSNMNAGVLLTVNTTSSQTIDGSTTVTLSRYSALHVISNGSNWEIY
jgi:hypothetical protein